MLDPAPCPPKGELRLEIKKCFFKFFKSEDDNCVTNNSTTVKLLLRRTLRLPVYNSTII